jgi:glycoside/pentoside/hexuronide:cation symporter, GPH family
VLKGNVHSAAPLPRAVKLGWAIGECAIASHMAIISIYLLFYLTEVHHFPGSVAGTLVLIPRVWNIICDPLMGGISDRWRSRWGRRRPFLLFGSLVWAVSFAAMFWIPEQLDLSQKAVWFLVSCFAVNTGLSLYHVPYSAMAAEMTRDYDERLSLIGYKEIAARSTVLLTVMASPLIVRLAPDPLTGNRWVGLATGALILVSGVATFLATDRAPAVAFQPQTMTWSEQLKTFRANKPLFVLSAAFLLSSACDAFYSALLIYLVTLGLGQPAASMGFLYPVGSFAAILTTAIWAKNGSRWGKRRTCIVAFGSGATCFLLSLVIPRGQPWMLFPFMALLGTCFAGIFLLPGAMVPDTVEYDEKISGTRREGTIYGAWIFIQQTGMAAGTFLVGVYLDLIGHKAGVAGFSNPQESHLLKLGFALIPAALLMAGILILRHFALTRPADAPPVSG